MHQSNSASGHRPFGTTPKTPLNRPDLTPHTRLSKLEATSVRHVRIVLTIASAMTTGTLALLGVASPAQANPMIPLSPDPTQCRQFGFPGHPIKLESPKNHENLEFNGSGPDVATSLGMAVSVRARMPVFTSVPPRESSLSIRVPILPASRKGLRC